MMRTQMFAALPTLALLVACGGGGGGVTQDSGGVTQGSGAGGPVVPPPPPGPTVQPLNVLLDPDSNILGANYNPATDKIRFGLFNPGSSQIVELDRNRSVVVTLPAGFTVHTSTGNRRKAIRASTPDGSGNALSILSGVGSEAGIELWRLHERLAPTVLPTGTAVYSGDYLGTLTRDPQNATDLAARYAPQNDEYIQGKVELTADFANQTIRGTISQRDSNRGRSFGNVGLVVGLIDSEGRFSGPTLGGELGAEAAGTRTTSSGADPELGYHGVIVGPDGAEAVGNVAFDHVTNPGVRLAREAGVFMATSSP